MRIFESWILSYLLNSLWQIPLLFAFGWVAARALRPIGAAAEHRVWAGVLLLQSVLPALSAMPQEWLRRLLAYGGVLRASGAQVTVVMGSGTGLGSGSLPGWLLAMAAIAYLAVCAYFAARFAWWWRRLSRLRSESVDVALTGGAAACWAHCAAMLNVPEASVAASSCIPGPVTVGFSKKLVLLPVEMVAGLPEAEMQAVIAHEFAHLQRNDFLKNLMYELLALPVAYHPLLRMTQARVAESREIVCDEIAADINGRTRYARSLLRLAALIASGTPVSTPHAIGIFDAKTFERRLMKLSEMKSEVRGMRRVAIVIACAAFGAATCGSALALHMQVNAATATSTDSAPKTAAAVNVPAGVMAGQRISGPNPRYPAAAKKARIQGKVVLDALIGKDGSVERVRVVSGPKELQASSVDSVSQWKYKPYLLNGDPVAVETTINVIYTLAK